ncbi:hypothetical protein AAP_03009 [Ascosphaera apis ARSEF 7405]|uniref:DUF1742-domain-containing protein n=1 Tax=Ascosphaera apis ARSEF 7405 TaxID=392613 RepID=A0A167Z9E7_9EURO|nr:hypothetical protein AAP_03009 [Ascosphaera apis ARSEF 7405]
MPLQNIWHHRRVADHSAKACEICYKPSTSVLITPDNKDFFYVCPIHLEDRGFASPIIDTEAEAAKRRKEALDKEIERVKAEYEEKMKRKAAEKAAEDNKDGENDKAQDTDKEKQKREEDDKKAGKELAEKIKSLQKEHTESPKKAQDEGPRIFALHKTFYQSRLDRQRNIEIARRNRERMSNPNFFPSAPKNDL